MDKTIMNECYYCTNSRKVAGNAHIQCAKPDAGMAGDEHGIRKGWFMYPLLFDPVWKTRWCKNFEQKQSTAVSPAVS